MDKIEKLDEMLDLFIDECYNILVEDDSLEAKAIIKKACLKICKEPKKSQGPAFLDTTNVSFDVGDGEFFPISEVKIENED